MRVPQTRPQDHCGGEGLGASFTLSRTQWRTQSRTHNQQRKHCMNAFLFQNSSTFQHASEAFKSFLRQSTFR